MRCSSHGTLFELGKQTVNRDFENENLWPILFSEFKIFGKKIASMLVIFLGFSLLTDNE